MDNRKIMIVRRDLGIFGGIERQILMLVNALIDKGITVYFLTDNPQSMLAQKLILKKVHIQEISFSNALYAAYKINNFCKVNNIKLIQSHMLKENFIIRIVKLLNRNILNIFRVHTYIDCSQISIHKKNLYHFISHITDSFVDHYLSINHFNVIELTKRTRVNIKKIIVLNNSVKSVEMSFENIAKPLTKIALIANFVPFKGHDILIKGLKLLKEDGIRLKAVIIGGEPINEKASSTPKLTNEIVDLSKNLGVDDQVNFAGFVSNVHEYIRDIPIIVLPSFSEGTPNCLLEAMSLKKIVIASRVGGIPEFIKDGKNGFLHEPNSAEEFANTVKRVLNLENNDIYEITNSAYDTWFNNYSESIVSEKYSDFIIKTLNLTVK